MPNLEFPKIYFNSTSSNQNKPEVIVAEEAYLCSDERMVSVPQYWVNKYS